MDADELILQGLAASVAEKRLRVEALGMQNVYGLDEIQRARGSMEYSQAQAALWNAEGDLRAEIARQDAKKRRAATASTQQP